MLTSIFDPDEDDSWKWKPKGEEGDWERCQCYCHRSGGRMVHVMACCCGGWKKTWQLIGKEMAAEQEARRAREQKATTYKPPHGGYPSV